MGRNKTFAGEVYPQPSKKNQATETTYVYYIDDTWSMDLLDLKGCGSRNIEGYRYFYLYLTNCRNSDGLI